MNKISRHLLPGHFHFSIYGNNIMYQAISSIFCSPNVFCISRFFCKSDDEIKNEIEEQLAINLSDNVSELILQLDYTIHKETYKQVIDCCLNLQTEQGYKTVLAILRSLNQRWDDKNELLNYTLEKSVEINSIKSLEYAQQIFKDARKASQHSPETCHYYYNRSFNFLLSLKTKDAPFRCNIPANILDLIPNAISVGDYLLLERTEKVIKLLVDADELAMAYELTKRMEPQGRSIVISEIFSHCLLDVQHLNLAYTIAEDRLELHDHYCYQIFEKYVKTSPDVAEVAFAKIQNTFWRKECLKLKDGGDRKKS